MSNIETPCPSCGNTTLFLDNTRRLVCTWIQCKQPVVQDKLNALAAELAEVKSERNDLGKAFELMTQRRDHWKQEAVHFATIVRNEFAAFGPEGLEACVDYQRAQAMLKEAGDE